jgi:hypothetical protein
MQPTDPNQRLTLDLGADEGRAGARAEGARRAGGVGSSASTSRWTASEQELRLFESRHELQSDGERRDDPAPPW